MVPGDPGKHFTVLPKVSSSTQTFDTTTPKDSNGYRIPLRGLWGEKQHQDQSVLVTDVSQCCHSPRMLLSVR